MRDPTTLPVWRALAAEAGIAADQIGEGVTLLEKATPEYHWTFARAFFPLSIGIERSCKLALQVDSLLASGSFLTQSEMRGHGHKVDGLVKAVNEICARRGTLSAPSTAIHGAIVATLASFASTGRYHHLDHLGGIVEDDPVQQWWETVVLPVCALHYSGARRARDEKTSREINLLMSPYTDVRHTHVDGSTISSLDRAMSEGARIRAANPWVRQYVLQFARWLAEIMYSLSWASHEIGNAAVPELHEFFAHFIVSDRDMRRLKQWRAQV